MIDNKDRIAQADIQLSADMQQTLKACAMYRKRTPLALLEQLITREQTIIDHEKERAEKEQQKTAQETRVYSQKTRKIGQPFNHHLGDHKGRTDACDLGLDHFRVTLRSQTTPF